MVAKSNDNSYFNHIWREKNGFLLKESLRIYFYQKELIKLHTISGGACLSGLPPLAMSEFRNRKSNLNVIS